MKKVSVIMILFLMFTGCALFDSKPVGPVILDNPSWIEDDMLIITVPDIPIIVEGESDAEVPMGSFGSD